jgi:hypothetical protein
MLSTLHLTDSSISESTEAKWQHFFDVFSSTENEEEVIDDWEKFSYSFDKEHRLLNESDSSC